MHLAQPGIQVWQRGYYDHVIRNEADYQTIWRYIDDNPAKWEEDKYFLDTEI
jgi:REP element-mobilizing transposase RayT